MFLDSVSNTALKPALLMGLKNMLIVSSTEDEDLSLKRDV